MDFSIPDHLRPTLSQLRSFVDEHVAPVEARGHEGFNALGGALVELRAKAKAAGLWLPQLPEAHGGMGLSVLEHGLVSEVLGRSPLGHYALNCQAPDAGNMEILIEYGSEGQHEQWLAPLLAGETRSCFGMTEPEHAGSNPTEMSTRAELVDGHWVINGHKWFTTGADGARFCIVMAVTDPDAPPHERASMIIVPTDAPGFENVRNISVMGEPGEGWMSHSEIRLTDVRVPEENLLGERAKGFSIAQARLGPGRIHHCMRWMGICNRVFEMMATRAATRKLGRGEVLGDKQTVQNWIAEAKADIDSTRLLVLHAAWSIDRVGAKAAREEISLIKFHAADTLMNLVDRAIQVHGALGITDDTMLSWVYRHERGARIYDGPDEVHKSVVARRILRAHGMPSRRTRAAGTPPSSPSLIDAAKPVREGEGLDLAKLQPWLDQALPDVPGTITVQQFPSGFSNLTYLLAKGDTELVLRRPPFAVQVKSGHDMAREHRVLSGLHGVYPPAPKPLAFCEDPDVLGAPFYVMERRRGVILRRKIPPELQVTPAKMRAMSLALVDNLAALHAVDVDKAGLSSLGKPEGYARRQVEGWIARFNKAKTGEVPAMDRIAAWLTERIPDRGDATLVHNDYKFDNVMLDPDDPTRITAVLDWEMCTLGDPLMDLGTTLGYWVEASDDPRWKFVAFAPTYGAGALTRRELAERYAEKTGRDVSNMLFYYCFALQKIATIIQQIYYRYHKGHTSDPRFSQLDQVVSVLAETAVGAAERGRY
ncbi:MAG: phosphotransferase [Myxococcota bacterium]